ncbi:ty3-gypsy retrotransposon protein [Tanacetum coccineum]
MPPRRMPSPSRDDTPPPDHTSLTAKIDQLIAATTATQQLLQNTQPQNANAAQLAALIKATNDVNTKLSLQADTTTMLVNHIQNLTSSKSTTQTVPPMPPAITASSSQQTSHPIRPITSPFTSLPLMFTSHTNPQTSSSAYMSQPYPNVADTGLYMSSLPPPPLLFQDNTMLYPPGTVPTRPPGNAMQHPMQPRTPKITLPLFDGSNPLDWIFQADNFFDYYHTPVANRTAYSVFYFTGEALSWYKHLAMNGMLGTWETFTRELEIRFGPSSYENHEATLFKLKQTTTVSLYQTEFERLSNRVNGLSGQTLKNIFISGLKKEIQNEIALLKPISLHQAYGQARLLEEKLAQPKPKLSYSNKPSYSSGNPMTTSSPSTTHNFVNKSLFFHSFSA